MLTVIRNYISFDMTCFNEKCNKLNYIVNIWRVSSVLVVQFIQIFRK